MDNLTQHLKVVGTESAGIRTDPAWYMIILKQDGASRIPHTMLRPGDPLPKNGFWKNIIGPSEEYVSVPVTMNTQLRHEFTSVVEHAAPGHSFEVDYRLGFAVDAPMIVATRWPQDPVRQLEKEIRRSLDPAARTQPWPQLREEIKQDGAAPRCQRSVAASRGHLDSVAAEYGLSITSLVMTLRLSRTDAEPEVTEATTERGVRIIQSRTILTAAQKTSDQTIKMMDVQFEQSVQTARLPGEFNATLMASIKVVAENLANSVHSPAELENLMRQVTVLKRLAEGSGTGTATAGGDPGHTLGSGTYAASLPPAGDPGTKLVTAIDEAFALVARTAGAVDQKRELLAAFLHLIAEASRGATADEEAAGRYQDRAAELVEKIRTGFGSEDFLAVRRFTAFDDLRERLK